MTRARRLTAAPTELAADRARGWVVTGSVVSGQLAERVARVLSRFSGSRVSLGSHRRERRIGIAGAFALAGIALLAASASASAVEPGWAPRGHPSLPNTQYIADAALGASPAECGPNAIVLFRVRGSGEEYGSPTKDKLGQWTGALGNALIRRGWRVRDLQARYSAPAVPIAQAGLAAARRNPAAVYAIIKSYRDVASREWSSVRSDLIAVARRCSQRKIAIAGYSQGGIILRYVLTRLPVDVQNQIVSVDLVADPTADKNADSGLRTSPRDPDSRHTGAGIDTLGARINPFFEQRPYPARLAFRTFIYCTDSDIVCDARRATVTSLQNWVLVGRIHTSYGFGGIGIAAWKRIGAPPLPAVTTLTPAPEPVPVPDPVPAPAGPGATPPPPWAETTGGATNTWTNYTNAGGTQGATIPAFTTVQIACKLTGFAVADGNTWWYRIASSPWNGTFYASADAFYNNGATSGSLIGTPFVDPNVAPC